MPTYLHICTDETCGFEWEDDYSICESPPQDCPKCKKNTAKRIIYGNIIGRVELYGEDLATKLKEDGAKMRKNIYASEKAYANIIGESNYQNIQSQLDKNKRGG